MSTSRTKSESGGVIRRAVLAGIAIAFISLAFIASYVGALHASTPHKIPIAVADHSGAAGPPELGLPMITKIRIAIAVP